MHLFLFSMHMYAHIYIHRSLLQFSVPNVIVSLKMEHSWAQCLFPLQFILDSTFSVSSCFPHLHTPSLQSGMNLPSTSWTLPWGNHCFRYFNWVSLCQRKNKKEKTSQPTSWELCFIWWDVLGFQAWETVSQEILRELFHRSRGGVRLYRNWQQGTGSLNFKRLLLIKENQISQVKGYSTFLCKERCQSLGSLK